MKQIADINSNKDYFIVFYGEDLEDIITNTEASKLTFMNLDEAIGSAKTLLMLDDYTYYACIYKCTYDVEEGDYSYGACIWEAWAADDDIEYEDEEKQPKKKMYS